MRPFEFVVAKDVGHALGLLAARGPSARVIAGGTDLLPELKTKGGAVGAVVDISRLDSLKGIRIDEAGLHIGALVTHAEIVRSPLVREVAPSLAQAAQSIGAVQTRNLGTLGGNLMTCVPSMDSGPLLLALDARATVAAARGSREMPVSSLFAGPRRPSLRHDELLTEIRVPAHNLGKPAAFLKFGLRKGQALALVNVAVSLWLEGAGAMRAPAVALGAVAPTVMRAGAAEDYLARSAATPEVMAEAGRIAAGEARPISDFRASADYRRQLVAILTARALHAAARRAQGLGTEMRQ